MSTILHDALGQFRRYDSMLDTPPDSWQAAGRALDQRAQQLLASGEAKTYAEARNVAIRESPETAEIYADVRRPTTPVPDADLAALKAKYGVKFPKALTAPTGRALVAVIMNGLLAENPNQNYGDLLHALLDRDVELRRAYARS